MPATQPSTIVGVATGSADGGVAILRLSGPRALEIARGLVGELPAPRRLLRRGLALGEGGHEDALVVQMPGPASFTGEDVVELHVHGGETNVQEIRDALLAAGARAAGPGDFTRRAFENGVLSLAQSEGVAALIGAQTRAGAAQARRLIAGELGKQVREVAVSVAELRTEVEAYLDFPDDVDDQLGVAWAERISKLHERVDDWLSRFELGRRAREVPRVVLAGAPNAGKSSLFNALLGHSRAIVADRPGTTRDFVEARLELGRHAVELVDTAGLRDADTDEIEAEGIEFSRAQLAGADLVLWIRAADEADAEPPVAEAFGPSWELRSKCDLEAEQDSTRQGLAVSVKRPESVDALREALASWVRGQGRAPWVGLARHRAAASEAATALAEAASLAGGGAVELLAFALQVAQQRLEEIEGRSRLGPVGAEVLDAIFSTFCIGK